MKITNKITFRGIVGNSVSAGDAVIFSGVITKKDVKTTNFGESIQFKGQFAAKNVKTGEIIEAPKMYVPSILEDMLDAADLGSRFCVGIIAMPDNTTKTGYHYELFTIEEPNANNDVALSLLAKFDVAMLPARTAEHHSAVSKDKKSNDK